MSGSIRGNATLHVYVYYEPDKVKTDCIQAMMKCQGINCSSLQFSIPRIVPKVEFINDHVNLGDIPLNLPTRITAVLQNFEFNEIPYEVDSDVSLVANCNVNPLRGKISPRGIAIIEVTCFIIFLNPEHVKYVFRRFVYIFLCVLTFIAIIMNAWCLTMLN